MKNRLKKWLSLLVVSGLFITGAVNSDLQKDQQINKISSITIIPNDLPWTP
jgi:hypothetical protein